MCANFDVVFQLSAWGERLRRDCDALLGLLSPSVIGEVTYETLYEVRARV